MEHLKLLIVIYWSGSLTSTKLELNSWILNFTRLYCLKHSILKQNKEFKTFDTISQISPQASMVIVKEF
jgi:predicted MPP superfamily phosphohydrolase